MVTMVDEVKKFLETVDLEEYHAVHAAAGEYVQTLKDTEVQAEIRAAADRAVLAGDGGAVWELKGLVHKAESSDPVIKRGIARILMNNPRWLKYFSQEFAKNVVTRARNGHAHAAAH
jgi:hypothetical protein